MFFKYSHVIFLCIATQFLSSCATAPRIPSLELKLERAIIANSDYAEARRLIAAGADINGLTNYANAPKNASGNTILNTCITNTSQSHYNCSMANLRFIVGQGADLTKFFYSGDEGEWADWHALHKSINENGNMELIRYFVDEVKVPLTTKSYGQTPYHKAVAEGNLEAIRYFVVEKNVPVDSKYFDDTPLITAVNYTGPDNVIEVVSLLIELGADTSTVNHDNKKPWKEMLKDKLAWEEERKQKLVEENEPSELWKNIGDVVGAIATVSSDASSGAANSNYAQSNLDRAYNDSMDKLDAIERNARIKTQQKTDTNNSYFSPTAAITKTITTSNSDCCYDVGLSDSSYGEALDKAAVKAQRVCAQKGSNLSPKHVSDEKVKSSGYQFKVRLDYRCIYKNN